MLGFIVDFFSNLVTTLSSVLPESPFSNLQIGQGVQNALGWLNWLVPVGDMAALFAVWLAAALIIAVVSFALKKGKGLVNAFTGGGE